MSLSTSFLPIVPSHYRHLRTDHYHPLQVHPKGKALWEHGICLLWQLQEASQARQQAYVLWGLGRGEQGYQGHEGLEEGLVQCQDVQACQEGIA